MTEYLTASPAYGRDYTSAKAVKEDWNKGLDFKLEPSGQYFNKDSFLNELKEITIEFRYAKLTKLVMIKPETRTQGRKG